MRVQVAQHLRSEFKTANVVVHKSGLRSGNPANEAGCSAECTVIMQTYIQLSLSRSDSGPHALELAWVSQKWVSSVSPFPVNLPDDRIRECWSSGHASYGKTL